MDYNLKAGIKNFRARLDCTNPKHRTILYPLI